MQMDVRRHGNLAWQQKGKITQNQNETTAPVELTAYAKAEDGKTEMSLLHFALTNPDWKPPQEEQTQFIQQLRCQVSKDAELLTTNNHGMQNGLPALPEETTIQDAEENILYASLNSLDAAGGIYSELANGILSDAGVMQSPSHFSRRRRATSPNQGKSSI